MNKRETKYNNQSREDKGDQMLKPYLLPGEEFITNCLRAISDVQHLSPAYDGRKTANQMRDALLASKKYETIRVLEVAYDTNGTLLPTHAAIVAKRKSKTA